MSRKVRGCIEPVVECSGKQATITKILRNPALAATEIHTIRDENRCLRCQLAHVVLFDAIENNDAIFPEGAEGDQIRKVVEIMDWTISKVLQEFGPLMGTLLDDY